MEKEIYWANLCVLNRKEAEMMEEASSDWKNNHDESYRMVYLGDTEETGIHDRLEKDLSRGKAEFSLLVSSRFDLFCSQKYLYGIREDLEPAGNLLPVRDLVRSSGVMDPDGFFQVLAILPHFILYNRDCLGGQSPPLSLETLLKPSWAGKVYIGNTDLPSGQSVLFAVWYLFGDEGLCKAVQNWRQKSAPSAVRFGLTRDEIPVGILPGIFCSAVPGEKLVRVVPAEGAPVLPSYGAVRKGDQAEDTMEFFKKSAGSQSFQKFYRDMGRAVVSDPLVPLPDTVCEETSCFFPPWEWILKQDMDYFFQMIKEVPEV